MVYDLSINIVNFRSRDYLKDCLSSLFTPKIGGFDFEVIVVNNDKDRLENSDIIKGLITKNKGSNNNKIFNNRNNNSKNSNNNSIETNLEEISRKKIKIINVNKNIGFAKGHNLGAKVAQGKYLWFLNPDCFLSDNNFNNNINSESGDKNNENNKITSKNSKIQKVIEQFEEDKNTGVIGARLENEKGEVQPWCAGREINFRNLIKNNLGFINQNKKIWENKNTIETDWVSGGALFIKNDLFKKLQGFDEKFFLYFEDVDLCRRVKMLNNKVLFFPKLKLLHLEGGSSQNKKELKDHYYNSQDYYFQKHFGHFSKNMVKLLRRVFV